MEEWNGESLKTQIEYSNIDTSSFVGYNNILSYAEFTCLSASHRKFEHRECAEFFSNNMLHFFTDLFIPKDLARDAVYDYAHKVYYIYIIF